MKYALIGCGRISTNHMKAAIANELDIVAVCDIVPEHMENLLTKHELQDNKKIKRYTDYKKMIKENKIDLIGIATESGKHAQIAIDCIQAGINVIIEKPISMSIKDIDRIIELAEEKKVVVSACHQNRFNVAVQETRKALEEGRFGKLSHGAIHVRWNRGKDYYDQATWRGTWAQDGGALMNQCIHGIDLLRWMMGDEIDEVYGVTKQQFHKYLECEDIGMAVVKFKNGAVGTIEGTTNVYPKNLEETLYLFGENGTVKLGGKSTNSIDNWEFKDKKEDDATKHGFIESTTNVYGNGHTSLYANVINAIKEHKPAYVDATAGKRALELVLAIYKSSFTGKPVKFPLDNCSTLDFVGGFDEKIKVCHVTSVHSRYDKRILSKECVSLSNAGHDVTLLCLDDLPNEEYKGVHIISRNFKPKNRIQRILKAPRIIFKMAKEQNADVYHLHDPELLSIALKLKRLGKKVIFDSHEDCVADIQDKKWIPQAFKGLVAHCYENKEKRVLNKIDGVISVTPNICNRLSKINKNVVQITNYPVSNEFSSDKQFKKKNQICFAGTTDSIWLNDNVVKAIEGLDVEFVIAGTCSKNRQSEIIGKSTKSRIKFLGKIDKVEVVNLLGESRIGMCIMNYNFNTGGTEGSLGNTKIFEYMACGLPIIASNQNVWQEIVSEYNCGIIVNPYNIDEIRSAIVKLLQDNELAQKMGENGRRAVEEKFNWETQKSKLITFYEQFIPKNRIKSSNLTKEE